MAHVHFRKPGCACKFVTNFLDGVYVSLGPVQSMVGLSHVYVHSDFASLLFSVMTTFETHGECSCGLTSSILSAFRSSWR